MSTPVSVVTAVKVHRRYSVIRLGLWLFFAIFIQFPFKPHEKKTHKTLQRKYVDVLTKPSMLILKLVTLSKQNLKSLVWCVMPLLPLREGSILTSEYIHAPCDCVLNWNPPAEWFLETYLAWKSCLHTPWSS